MRRAALQARALGHLDEPDLIAARHRLEHGQAASEGLHRRI
jgi:hypothetical protein